MADRKSVGKVFSCPDCGVDLKLVEEGESLQAIQSQPEVSQHKPSVRPDSGRGMLTPVRISIIVAVCLVAGIAVFVFSPGRPSPPPRTGQDALPEATVSSPPVPESPVEQDTSQRKPSLQSRLAELGKSLNQYRQNHFGWPEPQAGPASLQGGQFSWIATLIAEPGKEPVWQKSWQDPVNEAFVRRRLDPFLNPQIPDQVGEDRYPATHFVGVAGVGADAPRLPVNHPRAGIFGMDRVARAEDVKDGLANTMLVAGVQSQLGSWAAHGPATIRPFSAEPYLNGPDGFGTGDPDRMLVLMADGSVREVTQETSPVIVRRMAAMADGFALTPDVEGDPLTAPLPPELAASKPEEMPGLDPKRTPDEPPPPLFPNLEKSLTTKILQFKQAQPVTLRVMLTQLEELIGAPIEVSAATEVQLEQPVRLDIQETTIGDILKAALKETDLSFKADPMKGILLIRTEENQ